MWNNNNGGLEHRLIACEPSGHSVRFSEAAESNSAVVTLVAQPSWLWGQWASCSAKNGQDARLALLGGWEGCANEIVERKEMTSNSRIITDYANRLTTQAQRPGPQDVELQPERDGRVRCSAWLGGTDFN